MSDQIAFALLCIAASSSGSTAGDGLSTGKPQVSLNANFAGCIRPSIQNYSIAQEHVRATLKITKDINFSEGPCVCRGGIYYFLVYASDKELPDKRAWMFADSFYKANLAMGVLPVTPYQMPHYETIQFPALRNKNGQFFARYYVAIGCP